MDPYQVEQLIKDSLRIEVMRADGLEKRIVIRLYFNNFIISEESVEIE